MVAISMNMTRTPRRDRSGDGGFLPTLSLPAVAAISMWVSGCGKSADQSIPSSADIAPSIAAPTEVAPETAKATGAAVSDPVVVQWSSTPTEPEPVETGPIETGAVDAPPTEVAPSPESEISLDAGVNLEQQLAEFKIPPAWIDTIEPKWDTAKPWKEARQEIRRLLGRGDDASRREGIKLTWEYLQKKDIGNGHEYGMYMFLGNEPIWAVHVYREWLAKTDHDYPPYFGIKALASIYSDFGLFEEAVPILQRGLNATPPDAKWTEMREAEMHDAIGDLYVAWGKLDKAKASYEEAMRLYPLGKPPYGQHLLPRRAKKVQSKLDLLSISSLAGTSLRDGQYKETALGYSGDIKLTVAIKNGRIADIGVQHEEKIDQNACVLVPKRIVESQNLNVDGITGATVTQDAIEGGTLRVLKQAGLK